MLCIHRFSNLKCTYLQRQTSYRGMYTLPCSVHGVCALLQPSTKVPAGTACGVHKDFNLKLDGPLAHSDSFSEAVESKLRVASDGAASELCECETTRTMTSSTATGGSTAKPPKRVPVTLTSAPTPCKVIQGHRHGVGDSESAGEDLENILHRLFSLQGTTKVRFRVPAPRRCVLGFRCTH